MANYIRIAVLFTESELCRLEDSLDFFIVSGGFSEGIFDELVSLRDSIVAARRWRHQLDKSER